MRTNEAFRKRGDRSPKAQNSHSNHSKRLMSSDTPINVHVGSPAAKFPMDDVKLIHFHNFESLTTVKGEFVESPEFMCAGHQWKLRLYPGGCENTVHTPEESIDGMMAVYLVSVFTAKCTNVTVDYSFNVKKWDGSNSSIYYRDMHDDVSVTHFMGNDMYVTFSSDSPYCGESNFTTRDTVLKESSNVLNHGSLTIEVRIRLPPDVYCYDDKPQTSLRDNMLKVYLEENSEDVAFKVKGMIIKAHRTVLRAHVPELAELCETYDLSNPMPITDVKPETVQLMMDFVYGTHVQVETWKEQANDLLDSEKQNQSILRAAAKYGFSSLRMKAEAWIVKLYELKVDTAIECLLYADGNNLSLLKDATMKFITRNGSNVVESDSFSLLRESPALMTEVMKALVQRIDVLEVSTKRKRGDE